jgi:hypothetical protein
MKLVMIASVSPNRITFPLDSELMMSNRNLSDVEQPMEVPPAYTGEFRDAAIAHSMAACAPRYLGGDDAL